MRQTQGQPVGLVDAMDDKQHEGSSLIF